MKEIDYLAIASFFLTFLIAYVQWQTNEKKRKQDLYQKRADFRKRLLSEYLALDNRPKGAQYFNIEDLSIFIIEASWLFNNDLKLAINNLDAKELNEMDKQLNCLPDEIEQVFSKYLRLEYQTNIWQFFGAVILFFIPNSIKQYITERWFYYKQGPNTLWNAVKRIFKRG